MGKLRTSLTNAAALVKGVTKSVERQATKMQNIAKDVDSWVKSGSSGIDELYIYLAEKLKKQGSTYKAAENDQIKDHSDANVVRNLKGIQMCIGLGQDASSQAEEILADQALDKDLAALDKVLSDIAGQVRKKQKKLLQSKKYKTKIAGYAKMLADLQGSVAQATRTLREMRRNKPPSPARVRSFLDITDTSKLKDLEIALSRKNGELYKEYNSLVLNLNQTANDIRQHAEFAGHVKVIQDMIAEAEDMEKEGE
jgi:myosin heavy subunit